MKQKEVKQLSISDLSDKIKEEQNSLAKLKLSHTVSAIENPMKIRNTRRTVARLITELKNRNLSENK